MEISDFATEILRHGNFSIYPVEPIVRHGNDVSIVECNDEKQMLRRTADQILEWQAQGHETIAVICRDAAEASMVSRELSGKVTLADSDLETAEFGSGVIVLPVEYTKGLEFDAVLLYHPSGESYPEEDQYVKLLYVAATRALHELAVIHMGDLTGLIANPVSQEKRMQSLEMEIKPKVKQYERKVYTANELQEQAAIEGHREKERRSYLGPKPIVVLPKKTGEEMAPGVPKKTEPERIVTPRSGKNVSPQVFFSVPDQGMLRPKGHSRVDSSIRWAKKTKKYIDLVGSYGVLRLIPIEESVIRIQFKRGQTADFEPGYWNYTAETPPVWSAKEGKQFYEITAGKTILRADKKTGALHFFDKKGTLLVAEKSILPRQLETDAPFSQTWNYFDWSKKEKLTAKGISRESMERMEQKARYISFGGKKMRMPLLLSSQGYGLGIAAEGAVMCCTIPMYGPYIYTEGMSQIDYYFIRGGKNDEILDLYKKISSAQ